MTAVSDPAVDLPGPPETEVLFPEARRRARVRRLRVLVLGLLLAVLATATVLVTTRKATHFRGPVEISAGGPVVNTAAFRNEGELAFVSVSTLWVVDGSNGAVHKVNVPGTPEDPQFSADGKWLSFVENGPEIGSDGLRRSLWIAPAEGTSAVQVTGIGAFSQSYGWSPGVDLLAITSIPVSSIVVSQPTELSLVAPNGTSRLLVRGSVVGAAVWSPNGASLAVSTGSANTSVLSTYRLSGGRPQVWTRDAGWIIPVGWWPKWGIGYSDADGDYADAVQDGSSFLTISAPGARPVPLGTTLTTDTVGLPVANDAGDLAFVDGGSRVVWDGEHLEVCTAATRRCVTAPGFPRSVSVDPTWSADGSTLAFAEAPDRSDPAFFANIVRRWYNGHELWLYSANNGVFRKVASSPGTTVPIWSSTGHSLVYVSNDALWLLRNLAGRPVEIARPLLMAGNWDQDSFYGQIDWTGQFSWWSGTSH